MIDVTTIYCIAEDEIWRAVPPAKYFDSETLFDSKALFLRNPV
jgi:hypothetical protein